MLKKVTFVIRQWVISNSKAAAFLACCRTRFKPAALAAVQHMAVCPVAQCYCVQPCSSPEHQPQPPAVAASPKGPCRKAVSCCMILPCQTKSNHLPHFFPFPTFYHIIKCLLEAPKPCASLPCAIPNAGTGDCSNAHMNVLQIPPWAVWLLSKCCCIHQLFVCLFAISI